MSIALLGVVSSSCSRQRHVPGKVGQWRTTYFCPSTPSSQPCLRPWNYRKEKGLVKRERTPGGAGGAGRVTLTRRRWGKDAEDVEEADTCPRGLHLKESSLNEQLWSSPPSPERLHPVPLWGSLVTAASSAF